MLKNEDLFQIMKLEAFKLNKKLEDKIMVSLEEYLLTCPKKSFERLYLDSLNTGDGNFNKYEKIRCIRHLSIYNLITLGHKKSAKE